jgi:hypothetical protein
MTRRVAIVYYGLLRSVQYTMPNIELNVYEPLRKANIEFETYCHNYVFPPNFKYNNPRARELNQTLDPEPNAILKANHYIEDNQLDIMKSLDLASYRTHGDPWPSSKYQSLNNYILALYSRKKITHYLAEKLTSGQVAPYDYIFFMRSDVIYEAPLPITQLLDLLTRKHMCLIPNFQHHTGLNDRMFIASQDLALRYGQDYFDKLLELSSDMLLHSESVNKHFILNYLKAIPVLIPVYFSRVRSTGEIKKELYEP